MGAAGCRTQVPGVFARLVVWIHSLSCPEGISQNSRRCSGTWIGCSRRFCRGMPRRQKCRVFQSLCSRSFRCHDRLVCWRPKGKTHSLTLVTCRNGRRGGRRNGSSMPSLNRISVGDSVRPCGTYALDEKAQPQPALSGGLFERSARRF
jgi:hypothetical protein